MDLSSVDGPFSNLPFSQAVISYNLQAFTISSQKLLIYYMCIHNTFKMYHLSAFSAQSDINLDPRFPAVLACAEYRQTWPLHTKAYSTYFST